MLCDVHVLCIFAAADIKMKGLGVQRSLSVACIISETAVAMMNRAAAAGTEMPMPKKQLKSVARYLAHRATGCTIDSIKQASKPSRLIDERGLIAEFKMCSDDIDDDELEASVVNIIEKMELSPSFPKSLLQPLPEALERISGAWKSMQDEKAAASSGDEENAPMAAQPSTPHAALDAAIDRQTAALQTEMRVCAACAPSPPVSLAPHAPPAHLHHLHRLHYLHHLHRLHHLHYLHYLHHLHRLHRVHPNL